MTNDTIDFYDFFPNDTFDAGYVPIDEQDSLYYIKFDSRSNPDEDPLIIWLQGGPGCASELGMFTELGPYNLKYDPFSRPHASLVYNNFSWNNEANLMFVD